MLTKSVKTLWVLLLAVALAACATKVERIDTEEVRDLSGNWNDTDSRLVSEEMIRDVLSRPWLNRFVRSHDGRPPVVIVGEVRNLSHEHINVNTFIADMERALIKQYEADMAEVLPKVTPETMEIARKLAELPLTIRGFGPVKAQAEQMAAKRREELLAAFRAGGTPQKMAAE